MWCLDDVVRMPATRLVLVINRTGELEEHVHLLLSQVLPLLFLSHCWRTWLLAPRIASVLAQPMNVAAWGASRDLE